MAEDRKLLTAPEMDAMTPDERSAAVRAGIVTDLSTLPAEFRERVLGTGKRLTEQRRAARPLV